MSKKQIIFLLLFLLLSGLPAAADESSLTDPRQARIAVIVPEIHITAQIPDPAGETAILKKFLEAGFTRMVDQNQIEKIRNSNVVKELIRGDTQAAIGLGLQLGVDIIIVGEAFSELVGRVQGNMFSCRARVEVRAIRTDNAQIIAATGEHAGGVDLTEFTASKMSLNNAGELAGRYMVEQILKQGERTVNSVKLTVTGIPSFSRVNDLVKALRGLNGVETVRIDEYTAGVATLDLTVSVSVQTLAAMMSDLSSPRMEIVEISGSAMRISIR